MSHIEAAPKGGNTNSNKMKARPKKIGNRISNIFASCLIDIYVTPLRSRLYLNSRPRGNDPNLGNA